MTRAFPLFVATFLTLTAVPFATADQITERTQCAHDAFNVPGTVMCARLTVDATVSDCNNDATYHCDVNTVLRLEVIGYHVCGAGSSSLTPTYAPLGSQQFWTCVEEINGSAVGAEGENVYGPLTSRVSTSKEFHFADGLNLSGETRRYDSLVCAWDKDATLSNNQCRTFKATVTFPPWIGSSGGLEVANLVVSAVVSRVPDVQVFPPCSDGEDNDADGLVDGSDPDCESPIGSENPHTECADGYNNDADLWPDWPLDPQCSSPADDDESL